MSGSTFECPQCGAEVRIGRRACPECGSDDATGWQSSEEIDYQSLDLGDAPEPRAQGAGRWPRWWVLLVVAALLAWLAMG